jgi:hypothetical protein
MVLNYGKKTLKGVTPQIKDKNPMNCNIPARSRFPINLFICFQLNSISTAIT